jgi:zinc transporter 11
MLPNLPPYQQALLGTLFTWGVTALGASVVFLVPSDWSPTTEAKFLDTSLGFAAGVMLAASFWSLLEPALEQAEEAWGAHAYIPAVVGFALGALFVWISDQALPHGGGDMLALRPAPELKRRRRNSDSKPGPLVKLASSKRQSDRRILLLIIAVTLHNFPEGLAVGVGFGGVGSSPASTFEQARLLAIGIGLQNAPEGLAVSLPLRRMGYSKSLAFFYGQLSGMVEPIGGVIGAVAVTVAKPILPYALSFAAGAMVFVVVDSVVPESHSRGNGRLASWGAVVGFLVMMALDCGLG